MPRIVSILLAGSLLAHVALGCCGHVEHTCGRDAALAERAAASDCCEGDHDGPTCPAERDDPCKCRPECHGKCLFLPGATKLHAASSTRSSPRAAATSLLPATSPAGAARCWQQACQHFPPEQPVRLHLLHQLLLI